MKLTIRNGNIDFESEKFDIIIPCENLSKNKFSYVDFEFEENPNLKLSTKFFLNSDNDELTDINFYYMENTNLIFFRFVYQWGIIDLKTRILKRNITDYSYPSEQLHL
jgi:hypothetical protein